MTDSICSGRDMNTEIGRVEGHRKFCNKLWNATKFCLFRMDLVDLEGVRQKSNFVPNKSGLVSEGGQADWQCLKPRDCQLTSSSPQGRSHSSSSGYFTSSMSPPPPSTTISRLENSPRLPPPHIRSSYTTSATSSSKLPSRSSKRMPSLARRSLRKTRCIRVWKLD